MGVAPEHRISDGAGYLLSPMRKADLKVVDEMLDTTAEAVKNDFDGRPRRPR